MTRWCTLSLQYCPLLVLPFTEGVEDLEALVVALLSHGWHQHHQKLEHLALLSLVVVCHFHVLIEGASDNNSRVSKQRNCLHLCPILFFGPRVDLANHVVLGLYRIAKLQSVSAFHLERVKILALPQVDCSRRLISEATLVPSHLYFQNTVWVALRNVYEVRVREIPNRQLLFRSQPHYPHLVVQLYRLYRYEFLLFA